jgi:hypothetical protein
MKIPNGLKAEDLESCLKLRDLLDSDLMSPEEFNVRVLSIANRSSLDLASVAKQMESKEAEKELHEFSRVLDSRSQRAVVRNDDDDAELLRSIGLASEPRVAQMENKKKTEKKTVHDEGLSELDTMLRELGE